MRRRPQTTRPSLRALVASTSLAILVSSGIFSIQPARPVAAGTAETMEASILGWINAARVDRGLAGLRVDSRVTDLAGDRAATLAAKDELSHDAAGCLSCQLSDRGIAWNLFGETLASNSWPWGGESARVVFESWRDSPSHWDILMNPQFDTVGVGVGLAGSGATYASAILIDAPGSTAPAPTAAPKPKPAATPRPATAPAVTPAPAPSPVPTSPRALAPPPRQALSPTVDWAPRQPPSPRLRMRAGWTDH
ncbi:MAG: CAP domain-containing protein [Chloroflexi bacterium]|nr:CAP domain-containing protein [Chloroflexota bacterium]